MHSVLRRLFYQPSVTIEQQRHELTWLRAGALSGEC